MPTVIYVDDSGSMQEQWKVTRVQEIIRDESREDETQVFRVSQDTVNAWDGPRLMGGAPSIEAILDHAYDLSLPFPLKTFLTDERPDEGDMEKLLKNGFEVAVIMSSLDTEWADPSDYTPPARVAADPFEAYELRYDEPPVFTTPQWSGTGTTTVSPSQGTYNVTFNVTFDDLTQALDDMREATELAGERLSTAHDPITPTPDPEFERLLAEEEQIEREGAAASLLLTQDDPNRVVHARDNTTEVVRYQRASNWYLEPRDGSQRVRVPIAQAVAEAVAMYEDLQSPGMIFFGQPGGTTFDRLARRALGED